MRLFAHLLRDQRGASAAEFALVVPLFLILLLGIVDAGRLLWELNTIKKATQVGARMAVVTAPVDNSIATESYVGHDPGTGMLGQGDIIPASALGVIECDDTQCTCATAPCKGSRSYNGAAFNTIVARMTNHFSRIGAGNVTVSYLGSGLGFAGDPNGPDLSPTVEVEVSGLTFSPVTSLLFANVTIPPVRTSMTGEDQAGAASY
ncbi:TadE/TadG family type IV pilus assembly protein [Sphingomicrobium clamense]|uniref:Pilus assembly protein n=1 Tax=Sphingomicrobium clamense TaxID=2851013 RepID=A0ABS6V3D6_9SPHN|nr:TadE family protein [Sphingomicrobium sp. B8]MBW0144061.1 pilus assembly protein [Sphingomicrobium sp. B8]